MPVGPDFHVPYLAGAPKPPDKQPDVLISKVSPTCIVTLRSPDLDGAQLTDLSIVAATDESINVNCEENARMVTAITLDLRFLLRKIISESYTDLNLSHFSLEYYEN